MGREVMKNFATMTFKQAKEAVRCGFELETQSKHIECDCTETIDDDATDSARDEYVDDKWNDLPDWLLSRAFSREVDAIREKLYEEACDNVDLVYYAECQGDCNTLDIKNIEVGSDGSVDGHEFRTTGPLTVDQFSAASERLFRVLKGLKVDTGCSFHIHMSLPGVRHSYGQEFQSAMMEYLLKAKLPACVQVRLKSNARKRFFAVDSSNDKFRAVAFRGETWEFRLFGNVSTHRDALKCLAIAIKAFQFAYKVKFGLVGCTGADFKDRDDTIVFIKGDETYPIDELKDQTADVTFGVGGF